MPIPDQVKKQAEEAQRTLEAHNNPSSPDTGTPQPQQTGPAPAVAMDDNPSAQPSIDEPPQAPDSWEPRYRTLKGKYDAELPRAQSEIQRLQAENEALRAAQQQPAPAQNNGTPAAGQSGFDSFLSDQLLLDDDGKAQLRQFIRSEVAGELRPVQQTVQSDRESRFLAGIHPQYADLEHDPGFAAWLDRPVPGTGGTPRQFMIQAHKRFNVQDFNTWVDQYLNMSRGSAPPSLGDNPQLAQRVTPRTQSGAGSGEPADKSISMAEYSRRADRAQQLLRRGKREAADRIMAELNELHRQGLIRTS